MTKKQKEDIPEHIEKYYKIAKKVDAILYSREQSHRDAFSHGINDIVGADDFKLSHFQDEGKQKEIVERMVGFYLDKARAYLKSEKDHKFKNKKDEIIHNDKLLLAYMGLTKDQLSINIKEMIRKQGPKGLNIENYMKGVGQHDYAIGTGLRTSAGEHIENKHIGDIIEYTGAGDLVDKKKMEKKDAIHLLNLYDKGKGAVTKKDVKDELYEKKDDESD